MGAHREWHQEDWFARRLVGFVRSWVDIGSVVGWEPPPFIVAHTTQRVVMREVELRSLPLEVRTLPDQIMMLYVAAPAYAFIGDVAEYVSLAVDGLGFAYASGHPDVREAIMVARVAGDGSEVGATMLTFERQVTDEGLVTVSWGPTITVPPDQAGPSILAEVQEVLAEQHH